MGKSSQPMPDRTKEHQPPVNMTQNTSAIPGAIIIGALMISISILISGGVLQLKGLAPNKNLGAQASSVPQAAGQVPPENTGPVSVSLDDDPVLGDKNAKVTIVEFSDYECPFCKRHFEETYSQLKEEYIDTGKVKLVYRDYPLPFHDPLATKEAVAANCIKKQLGDTGYFKIHDEIFTKTTSNGNGLTEVALEEIATAQGINLSEFKSCMDDKAQNEEVQKDVADGQKYGVSGTPSFFIGKSTSNGTIEGTALVGAQPYSVFKTTIDKLLN